jgi:predicted nucleotidyltransferase
MTVEDKLQGFVSRLRDAAGNNLTSVILYGSAAAGNFREGVSDLNVLCIVRDLTFSALQTLAPAMRWWSKQKQPQPLVITRDELERSRDVFTIELLDIQRHHRVLLGDDVLQDLQIPMHFHRMQVEYELREKLVLFRQNALVVEHEQQMRELLVRSLSSFLTLFRHALIAFGESLPADHQEAVERLSRRVGFDPAAIMDVMAMREGAKAGNIKETFAAYLSTIEKVVLGVDQILKGSAANGKPETA